MLPPIPTSEPVPHPDSLCSPCSPLPSAHALPSHTLAPHAPSHPHLTLVTSPHPFQAAQLTQHPALDAVFIKGEPPRVVATDILAAYHRRLSADRLSADQQAVRLM